VVVEETEGGKIVMSRSPAWRKALPAPADGKGNLRVYAKQDVGGATMEVVFDYCDLPTSVVTEILKFAQEAKARGVVEDDVFKEMNEQADGDRERITRTVHILRGGVSFCLMPGVPKDWPKGHVWVSYEERALATCGKCRLADEFADPNPLTSERDIK
jgi:hypothetical protein